MQQLTLISKYLILVHTDVTLQELETKHRQYGSDRFHCDVSKYKGMHFISKITKMCYMMRGNRKALPEDQRQAAYENKSLMGFLAALKKITASLRLESPPRPSGPTTPHRQCHH